MGKREGDLLEDLEVDGRITLRWLLKTEGADWIYLAGDGDTWQALFNTVMNLWDSLKCG